MIRLQRKHGQLLFALLMSFSTTLIVSGVISLMHHATITAWLEAFFIAWPLVFIAIVSLAPRVNRLVESWIQDA